MTQTKKIFLYLLLCCFFQCSSIIRVPVPVHWPFIPMNLFSKMRGQDQRIYYFKLKDSAGKEILVHGKYVVPIEHFRANWLGAKEHGGSRILILNYLK
jgi:hypothetical protein